MIISRITLLSIALVLISACTSIPEGLEPIKGFELDRYQGKWYEIARLDHSFERGLNEVTAEYELMQDGNVKVTNRGLSEKDKNWSEAIGKAKFVNQPDEGFLKVSFFGPFYGSYVIFELDEQYQYAFVSGPNTSYLWLLSRTPTLDKNIVERFLTVAESKGFDTDNIIFPKHTISH